MEVSRTPSKIGKTSLLTSTPPASKRLQDDHQDHESLATAFDLFYSGRSSSAKSSPRPALRSHKNCCPLASEERVSLLGDSFATVLDLSVNPKGAAEDDGQVENNNCEKNSGIDESPSGVIKNNGTLAARVVPQSHRDDVDERAADDEGKNGDSNFKRNRNPMTKGESGSTVNEAIRDDDSMGDKTRKGEEEEEVPSFQTNGKKASGAEEEKDNESGKVKKEDNPSNECEEFKGGYSRQIFAAFAANFGAVALGSMLSWTSPALPDLRERKSIGEITTTDETWISTIALLGAAAACPIVGIGIERFGRRRCLLLLSPPFIAGWVLITFSQNIYMMYVGRFLTGFSGGGGSIAIPVYVTESVVSSIRGMCGSFYDMMITIGILYTFVVGTFVSWEWQAVACGIIPVVFHLLMLVVPESPTYLVKQGRHSDASKALQWLRGASSSQQVETELQELTSSVNESTSKSATWTDLLKLPALKPTVIAVLLMVFQQLAAIDAVMFFTVDIFASSGADINENLSANIVGAIQVLATITAAIVVDYRGRRFLLLISEIFMVISLGTLGLFFYLKENGNPPGWLPLGSLMVYVVAFSVGMGPLPWLLMGELLPLHVKGKASGIVTITRWLLGFAVTFLFQFLLKAIGNYGTYWVFSVCCFFGAGFVFLFVPETKGKTLDDIQGFFSSDVVPAQSSVATVTEAHDKNHDQKV